MKKLLCCLLILAMVLPLSAAGAEGSAEAVSLAFACHSANDKEIDASPVTDGSDETGIALKKDKKCPIILVLDESAACHALYFRLSDAPDQMELQLQNEKKKWESVLVQKSPGVEFTVPVDGLSGKIKVIFSFSNGIALNIKEIRCFSEGTLPDTVHTWKSADTADVLLVADSLDSIDLSSLQALCENGLNVMIAGFSAETPLLTLQDAYREAGLEYAPLLYTGPINKKESKEKLVADWIRRYQPLLAVSDGALTETLSLAAENAVDPAWNPDSAAEYGVWALPARACDSDDYAAMADELASRDNDLLREWCASRFAEAEHASVSDIPYPADRLENGYLAEGEFVYENADDGLWAYLSPTLQVEIVRYAMPDVPHRWFEANVIFKPESEMLRQHVYVNATFKGQQIYPETLAQTSRLVFAVNGDYYPYRADKKMNVGNIIRQGTVLYNFDPKHSLKYPNLDTMVLRDDGTLSVYAASEYSADELLAQGNVHDALSFGPYLVRGGKLRAYNGNSADVPEPRSAFGMVEPGHFFFVMVEGKMPKGGEQGMNLYQLAELLYARGVVEGMNIDGGSTATMIFMGTRLHRTGKGNVVGSPRNQHELFGIGTSDQVHTDMADGKKK